MRNRLLALVAISLLVPVSGAVARQRPARHLTPAESTAALGLDLLRRFPAGNVVLSPDSIATGLAMLGEGARGKTAAQIAHVTHLASPRSFAGLGTLQKTLAQEAGAAAGGDPEAPRMSIANGLFLGESFAVEPAFVASVQHGFGAAPVALDFRSRSATAAGAINEWVSAHTEGVIAAILKELSPATDLVLANAVYLDARWLNPFKPEHVATGPFHAAGGVQQVPFMNETASLPYAASAGYRAVELPYRSSTLSLLVVVPTGSGLERLQRNLTARGLAALARRLSPREVELSVPRFHVALNRELGQTLAQLGMPLAFLEGSADLSGISREPGLHVGPVIHAADIRVQEDGTVAAAATVIGVEAVSRMKPVHPVRLRADRPFLFFLRDTRTGAVLFAGRLADASTAQS